MALAQQAQVSKHEFAHGEDEEEEDHFLEGYTALKFLLAGGVAGAGKLLFSMMSNVSLQSLQYHALALHPSTG